MKNKLIKILSDICVIVIACVLITFTLGAVFNREEAQTLYVDEIVCEQVSEPVMMESPMLKSAGENIGQAFDVAEEELEIVPQEEAVDDGLYHPKQDRYKEILLNDDEIELIARIVYLESNTETPEGQKMVAEVILNRIIYGAWGDTVEGVIYAPYQFTTAKNVDSANPNEKNYEAVYSALDDEPLTDVDVIFFATRPENNRLFAKVGNHYFCYAYNW